MADIKELLGKTITEIKGLHNDSEHVRFNCDDGSVYTMFHSQDCCENVRVVDLDGVADDIIGSPVLVAEEVVNEGGKEPYSGSDSWTWTFYKIRTNKGSLTIRWLGESNGYYSEEVYFSKQAQ